MACGIKNKEIEFWEVFAEIIWWSALCTSFELTSRMISSLDPECAVSTAGVVNQGVRNENEKHLHGSFEMELRKLT